MATRDNPSWATVALLGIVGAGAAYVFLKRPDLPGTWDEWVYAHLPKLPSGTLIQTHTGETASTGTTTTTTTTSGGTQHTVIGSGGDPLFGDVTLSIA